MNYNELFLEWEKVYDTLVSLKDDEGEPLEDIYDMDFQNVCLGFCMTKGLSYEEHFDFYKFCTTKRKF